VVEFEIDDGRAGGATAVMGASSAQNQPMIVGCKDDDGSVIGVSYKRVQKYSEDKMQR